MLTDNTETIISNGVATIAVKYIIPKGISTVIWPQTDDYEQLHTNKLNNLLYVPDSTVNILSATALDESINDDEETWLLKKIYFYLGFWEVQKDNISFINVSSRIRYTMWI